METNKLPIWGLGQCHQHMVAYNIEAVTQVVATSTYGDNIIRLKTILIDWQLHWFYLQNISARKLKATHLGSRAVPLLQTITYWSYDLWWLGPFS